MSNFQRTRSKVWWGDSPPNIGSPVAGPAEWNGALQGQDEADWEPQLPHWIANHPEQQRNNSADNIAQHNAQWPLRHGSPGSHKSQDSGFSDSDSSPPNSNYYPSPDNESKNKSSSSSDSNNNENITVKQAIDFQNTPPGTDEVDKVPTPKPRLRSSSVIQTPLDLQKYYEVHNDEEHMELLKDKSESPANRTFPETNRPIPTPRTDRPPINKTFKNNQNTSIKSNISNLGNKIEITITPPSDTCNKENNPESAIVKDAKDVKDDSCNIISPSKKYPVKSFVSSKDCTKISKVAVVKDLETNLNKSKESLEYLKLSDDNEIAVKNEPRMRSPISNISYVPTEKTSAQRLAYKRSMSQEEEVPISVTPKFQRNRLNKSLNLEAQKLDQQILNIQDGHRSLSHVREDLVKEGTLLEEPVHKPSTAILGKNIMDSLHLKPNKKNGPKLKHRLAAKAEKAREQSSFKFFSPKKEVPRIVETHAAGIVKGSRVPSLGLPRTTEHDSWVIVGHPEQEKLIPNYNERLIDGDTAANVNTSDKTVAASDIRNVTPPPEFQDKNKKPYQTDSKSDKDLSHDSKREKLKEIEELNFGDVQLDLACMSTPKMLAPHEFMHGPKTPKTTTKKTSRINLLDNFNGLVLNNQNEILYRERSIDHTTLERICERKPEPVQYWLCDLIGSNENECMTTLQSKPLGAEVKALVSSSSATITGNIKKVQTHGQIIVHQYSDVIRQIESNTANEEQICLLVANINEFVLAHSITLNTKPPGETPERWDKIKKALQLYLQKLIDIGEDVKIELNETTTEWPLVEKHLETLIGIFIETAKAVLVQQMKTLVSIVEEPPSDVIQKSTLTSIGHLAMLSEHPQANLHEKCQRVIRSITELPFVDCAVPRALLTAIIESNKSSVKALALRALATVCMSADAVKQFEEGGGIEILSDILSDHSNPEPQMREAITVLTQITAPWLRGHYDLTQLHLYLNSIVENITSILSRTECCQLLLLCTACLVNLVRELELEGNEEQKRSDIIEVIAKHKTLERLLDAVKRRGPNISVFLQEQTASFLASLCRVSRCVLAVSRSGAALAALASFTRRGAARSPRPAEARAQARLHAHAAHALSRLCVIPDVANQIVQLEGVPHLISLVRMQRKRPTTDSDPDQTLIYCLKALRTIHKHCPEAFKDNQEDVDEMIRPHLMESLMLFSAKQESYV